MAIYHLHVKIIGRATGRSAVAAAAYRSASRLKDHRLDRDHDFTDKSGVVHSEVMLPDGASEEWRDRERLWNDVEAAELRRDAQLAREVEFAIPRELNQQQGIALARDFVAAEFVERGMVADLNVHWDIGADGTAKPHAHVMLTMREAGVDDNGDPAFGAKVRDWNRTELVEHWREAWAVHANERLAELDIDVRIDHRSFVEQGIKLEPQSQIGAPARRMEARGLEADRADLHREIARENGARIVQNPSIALDAITHQQSTFTTRDLAMFVHRHSDGLDQFNEVMSAVRQSPDLIELGKDGRGEDRFTSRAMIEAEQRLQRASDLMAQRERHRVADKDRDAALARAETRGLTLSCEQRDALAHITDGRDLGIVVGHAGTGKSAMLGVAREAWEAAGYEVRGTALSGIAAENLEAGSAIPSRTLASLEHGWEQGRDLLTSRDVLVIDEAGMVGTRQLERVAAQAAEAGAKLVLVGDPQQLQLIEAGAAFRSLHERHGGIEITEVRRQHAEWQREATRDLAGGRTGEALAAYRDRGMVHAADTREAAREELIDRWDAGRQASPDASRIILTHTNAEVRELNELARERMRLAGDLGAEVDITVERGERAFASGDRVMFLKNERSLEVKNGTLGTIEQVSRQSMTVRTDDGRQVAFDFKDYAHVDHGYVATIHKAQGMTVDHSHVLATPGMDAHGSYVALSRHRDGMDLHYGRDDFAHGGQLARTLGRDRAKDMASDYARADPARDFAERRGLTFRERVAEVVRKVVPDKVRDLFDGLLPSDRDVTAGSKVQRPERVRGQFEGLRLRAEPVEPGVSRGAAIDAVGPERQPISHTSKAPPEKARSIFAGLKLPAPSLEPAPAVAREPAVKLRAAVQRHARAVDDIFAMRDKDLPVLPHQRTALDKARADLNTQSPYAARDIETAYRSDRTLVREAVGGQTSRAIRAMQLETEIRTTPALRADRFVERWRQLDGQRQRALARDDFATMRNVQGTMGELAGGLHRDPQLESLLAGRKRDLGLEIGFERGRSITEDLMHSIGLGRGRGLGL